MAKEHLEKEIWRGKCGQTSHTAGGRWKLAVCDLLYPRSYKARETQWIVTAAD